MMPPLTFILHPSMTRHAARRTGHHAAATAHSILCQPLLLLLVMLALADSQDASVGLGAHLGSDITR